MYVADIAVVNRVVTPSVTLSSVKDVMIPVFKVELETIGCAVSDPSESRRRIW